MEAHSSCEHDDGLKQVLHDDDDDNDDDDDGIEQVLHVAHFPE